MRALLLLLLALTAPGAVFPNPLASGSDIIAAAPQWTGSESITLGRPAALINALDPTKEWTILIRFSGTTNSVGTLIACADNTNVQFSARLSAAGTLNTNIGGVGNSVGATGTASPLWHSLALSNRLVSAVMQRMIVFNDGASVTGSSPSGTTTCTRDITIGCRRNTSNSDTADNFTGLIGAIAIWNFALTDDQIHWAMGYMRPSEMIGGSSASGLIAYYPCNETSGTTLHDVIAGNDGTESASLGQTSNFPKYPVSGIGDSLTQGNGSPTSTPYFFQLSVGPTGVRGRRSVHKYGFSGATSATIAGHMSDSAYAPYLNWTQLIYVGRNDMGNNASVISNLATMVALVPHNRYLILGQRPGAVTGVVDGVGTPTAAGTEDWGTTARAQVDSMNYAVQAIYGSRWVNTQNMCLIGATLPGEANDVFQRRTITHYAHDSLHMIDNGYTQQSVGVDVHLTLFGW